MTRSRTNVSGEAESSTALAQVLQELYPLADTEHNIVVGEKSRETLGNLFLGPVPSVVTVVLPDRSIRGSL